MKAEVLLDLLSGKPVTRREIRQQTGYPDREIRQAVRDLRLSGVRVVTAENGGYYIAKPKKNIYHFAIQ